jgi:uncharacterized cupin superfamily protein
MTADELRTSKELPAGLSAPLAGLWHMAKGDWHTAHKVVQDDEGAAAAWVHAHLHRVEGDESNAGYWYARAGKPHATNSHAEEWNEIAGVLLAGHGLL